MADLAANGALENSLNLTPEEKRAFQYLFQQADTEKLGVITGEVAVKFFERTKLQPAVLGEIWQIADTENRGLLTSAGFCQVLRLIGHYQAGRDPSPELAFQPAPTLPKFEGLSIPSAPAPAAPVPGPFAQPPASNITPQVSGGGPIRVPPLSPAKAAEYAGLFEKSGASNGLLSGENAKQIFEKARLPNETLGRIWNLADTEQRGALGVTEFIIAMHLLASFRTGAMKQVPTTLPAGLYEAAARRGPVPALGRQDPIAPIPRQFSGQGPQRTHSPLRNQYNTPPQSVQATGSDWAISPQEKTSYDNLFNKVDTTGRGFITGEQAVHFFSDSGLPEDVLAGIWDLADINSEGQLSKDEFAVAMYLIRQQRKQDRTPLPTTLPPHLIPPSMRNQIRQAPIAAPEPPPAAPQPKSAADDLFGLDAFSAPSAPAPLQLQQTTGGSAPFSKPFDNDPFASKTASPTSPQPFQPSPRNPASTFKPFLPTSSFGQTLTTQSTGASAGSGPPRGPPSAMDDLLGESDPEINKKLTQDSTELANMSNQMTTLRNQMQEVQNKSRATESDLNSVTNQKRELELRLSQFKAAYEKEVKDVKALEDRLASSRTETRKLQQDLAILEGTLKDLQSQHQQVGTALEADQRENNNLKDRIRQANAEIGNLRPQLDKLRNDARQQKGMVAINKKQLATNEGERDKIKNEMNDLNKAAEEYRSVPAGPTSNVASPAASTASHNTNPFFRKSPQPSENTMSPSGFAQAGPHKDFDSVFGSFGSPQTSAPPTSFRADSQTQVPTFSAPSGQSVRSSEGPDVPTPSTSPPLSSYQESPRAGEPPAPPESRQFGSSFLPLRNEVPRSDSFSSSVKVSAPASRYGGPSGIGNETPTISAVSPAATPVQDKPPTVERTLSSETQKTETDNFNPSLFDRISTASPVASITSETKSTTRGEDRKDTFSGFGGPLPSKDLPGAFPRDTSSPLQQMPTGGSSFSEQSKTYGRSDPFSPATNDQPRPGQKVDFDAAFAGFGSSRQNTEPTGTNGESNGAASKFNKEFPPIEDIGRDDDSDSASEQGFADNFTSASPQQHRSSVGQSQAPQPNTASAGGDPSHDDLYAAPPPTTRLDSNVGGLPSPTAQKSPPSYESTVGPHRSGSNQFPPEFGGLLPARTDPTSPTTSQSPEKSFASPAGGHGAALFGGSSAAKSTTTSPPPADTPSSTVPSDAYHSAVSQPPSDTTAQAQPKSAFNDDFDAGFDDLTDAKEADDKTDDDLFASQHREGFDEFNPVFDSPAASKANTMQSQQTPTGKAHSGEDSFSDFEHLSRSFGQPAAPQPASSSQDWDAIFSNMESSQDKGSLQAPSDFSKSVFDSLDRDEGAGSSKSPTMPQLGRAISTGTEHDDPILKKLTGMGYSRDAALGALEKFDYDINKAADYLTSSH